MNLDPDDFEQARQARDPHFDGRVFIGVLTTGIYCRPVCPVRIPRKENIRLFRSAAAAAEAGFRPCLRCRPESSPGTPAWLGSSHTVSRALQLIAAGALNEGSVAQLAARLGIGARQLTRLFRQHLGVTPLAVASTQRLHFAKQLISETSLPMTDVCFAAGYSSVRRFNTVFSSVYGRGPLALRRQQSDRPHPARDEGLALTLHWRPPFDWSAMLEYLALRAIPGVERVTNNSYARTFLMEGAVGDFRVRFQPGRRDLTLTIRCSQTRLLQRIVERVKIMFDLNAVSAEVDAWLAQDPHLQPLVRATPGIRVPVAWDGFEVAVRAIVGQQVSVKGATTLVSRLARACGTPYDSDDAELTLVFPTPEQVLAQPLQGLGITTRRVAAIHGVAQALLDGELHFDGSMTTDEFVAAVTRIPGIGPWTAQYIALRALNDPDAFPHADLVLLRAAAGEGETLSPAQLLERSRAWRPWRAYSVMLLWRHAG